MGRRVCQAQSRGCGLRAGRRSGPHPAKGADGLAGEADSESPSLPSEGADVGLPAKLQPGVVGRVRRYPQARAARLAERGCISEEHTSELQSLRHLVCRLLLEKKKQHI